MYASMIVMGMWHYVGLNWLAWGVHHATGLVFFSLFDRFIKKRKMIKRFFDNKIVQVFSHILTFIYVSLGYAFVGNTNIGDGFDAYINAIISIPKAIYMLFA